CPSARCWTTKSNAPNAGGRFRGIDRASIAGDSPCPLGHHRTVLSAVFSFNPLGEESFLSRYINARVLFTT
ncbi:MAG TPA: hypothetical protein PKV41_06310, partial [Candidatus Omnitrophota bacterium]|nr:hypothetical protein [Candidatus Omnitrophota bacterium]